MVGGVLDLTAWQIVLVILGLTHITIVSVTVFLHRHQAHRALDLHPVASHFFRLWLWLTTGMVTKAWVAIHRKHHARCETEEDPHSPQVKGIRKVLLEGAELYKEEAKNSRTLEQFGHGTPDDMLERRLYSRYPNYGIFVMLALDLLLFGVIGLTVWAVQMLWIPFFAAGVINGIGHWWGYRNYEVNDASTNIVPWGILIGGEELHNNHHTFASSARLSSKWWEFDIGWLYIRILAFLHLARVRRVPPKTAIDTTKIHVDMDTLTAVVTNRFQVMARYGREVLARVYRDEKRRASGRARELFRRTRRLLVRNESLIDTRARQRLESLLSANARLDTVYRFKQKLQQIWQMSAVSNDHLLKALQEWCRQAEETGIRSLQDFARALRGYSQCFGSARA